MTNTPPERSNGMTKFLAFAFVATVFGANWFIGHVGSVAFPGGPHTIPVWPGIDAPSGVLFVGIGFTLRDLLHDSGGRRWVVGAILVGAALSALLAGVPRVALASGVAFLASEGADFAVYDPLHRKHWLGAVALSNVVGLLVDSALFLWIAFGSLSFITGQIIGKVEMTVLAVAIMAAFRAASARRAATA